MIIGLTGYAQSGKDTVAKVLVEEYGYKRVAFADKIRELLYLMNPPIPLGVSSEKHEVSLAFLVDTYGWDKTKLNPHVRALLQNLGFGARKLFSDDFWIKQVLRHGTEDNLVITDVRFVNEASYIRAFGLSQIWRIKRPGVEAVNNHISESEMDDYKVDQILHNGGTIEELESLVRQRMESLIANKTD